MEFFSWIILKEKWEKWLRDQRISDCEGWDLIGVLSNFSYGEVWRRMLGWNISWIEGFLFSDFWLYSVIWKWIIVIVNFRKWHDTPRDHDKFYRVLILLLNSNSKRFKKKWRCIKFCCIQVNSTWQESWRTTSLPIWLSSP